MGEEGGKISELYKIWIFIKYILTEPFKQIRTDIKKIKTWFYIYTTVVAYTIFFGTVTDKIVSIIMWIILLILKEYEKGDFMKVHREKYGKYYK